MKEEDKRRLLGVNMKQYENSDFFSEILHVLVSIFSSAPFPRRNSSIIESKLTLEAGGRGTNPCENKCIRTAV